MNTIFMLTLQQTATQGNAFMQFLPLILIVVVFWFFMIRPQMKRQKELKKYRDELKKGDKVMTTGGIFGKIVEINDFTVIIEVESQARLKVSKEAIVKDICVVLSVKYSVILVHPMNCTSNVTWSRTESALSSQPSCGF